MAHRVLLVTRNLPPLLGGMERLNWHMAEELSRHGEVRVVGPEGAAAQGPPAVNIAEIPLTPLWRFLLGAQREAVRIAREWRPDIVLAGSGLTAPLALITARLSGTRAATYVHGLDVAVPNWIYRTFWFSALRRMDRIIANSAPTAELARKIGVPENRIGIVYPGVSLPETQQDEEEIRQFRKTNGLGDRPILLSVGRLTTRKGLREFVKEALPRIVAQAPEALLLVIGDAPDASLHAEGQSPQSIQAQADTLGLGEHIRFLGVITDWKKLSLIYRASSVHVFPVRDIPGDPEGFGMVAIEAAAHGLPTAAFATGGIVDAVAEGRSGRLLPPGDYPALAQAVLDLLATPENFKISARQFAEQFAWEAFGAAVNKQLTQSFVS